VPYPAINALNSFTRDAISYSVMILEVVPIVWTGQQRS
jgi:hypothetical protein